MEIRRAPVRGDVPRAEEVFRWRRATVEIAQRAAVALVRARRHTRAASVPGRRVYTGSGSHGRSPRGPTPGRRRRAPAWKQRRFACSAVLNQAGGRS